MNKIIRAFFLFWVLSMTLFAQISNEQVNKYIDISRAKGYLNMVQYDFVKRYTSFFSEGYVLMFDISSKEALKMGKKEIESLAYSAKYLNAFKNIFHDFNFNNYTEVIQFYNSDCGKKFANLGIPISAYTDMNETIKYLEKVKNTKISDKRTELYNKISQEFNTTALIMENKKLLLQYTDYSTDEMVIVLEGIKKRLRKFNGLLMHMVYIKFSDNELKQVLEYASSNAGKMEMRLIYKALQVIDKIKYKDIDNMIARVKKKMFDRLKSE